MKLLPVLASLLLFALASGCTAGHPAIGLAPTPSPVPTADIEATLDAEVRAALPGPTPVARADIEATVQARPRMTVVALPTATSPATPTSTTTPTPTVSPSPTPPPKAEFLPKPRPSRVASTLTQSQATLAPTSTPRAAPELPVIRLGYKGQVYDGLLGSFCWPIIEPSGQVSDLCGDAPFQETSPVIPVGAGESLAVEVEADELPLVVTAVMFGSVETLPLQEIALGPYLTGSFDIDLPAGLYIVHIFGQWLEGDLYYAFKIKVE